MSEANNTTNDSSGSALSVIQKVDAFRKDTNRVSNSRPRADALVKRYEEGIRTLHNAGRPQEDALFLIEIEEGQLLHKPDTLRKAINKMIPDWRKQTTLDQMIKSDPEGEERTSSASSGSLVDDRFMGGGEWTS